MLLSPKSSTQNTFDSFLENRIKFGRYNLQAFVSMGFSYLSDGCEVVALSLILPVIKNEFTVSAFQQSALGSALLFGFFLGSVAAGFAADKYGRKRTLIYASLIQIVIGFTSTMVYNIKWFLITRGVFGFIIGFTVVLAPTMISEITPIARRGRDLVIPNFFFSGGKLLACIFSFIAFENLQQGNWRLLVILSAMPVFVVIVGSYLYLEESPRYLLMKGQVDEAVRVLNRIGRVNNGENFSEVTEEEKKELTEWRDIAFRNYTAADIKPMFEPEMRYITSVVFFMWFSLSFVFYGLIFILPLILAQIHEQQGSSGTGGLWGVMIPIFAELPSVAVSYHLIEKRSFGRRNMLTVTFLGVSVSYLGAFILSSGMLEFCVTIGNFFTKIGWATITPYTAELFPTPYRSAAYGLLSGFGRIGAAVSPLLLYPIMQAGLYLPFFIFSIMMATCSFFCWKMPYDTTGKPLDIQQKMLLETENSQEMTVNGQIEFPDHQWQKLRH